jgi:peptidyl-prolyl cis-trans isomerase SurA
VAADLSDDRASAIQGGNVGWSLISYLAEGYANAVREAELNTVLGPVETEFGLHLIEVLDRKKQTLTQAEFEESASGYFRLWVQTIWGDATIERSADWNADIPTDPGLSTLAPEVITAVNALVAPAP